jgi:predicted acylesterase/phospholipase RssA
VQKILYVILRRFYTNVSSDQIYISRGINALFEDSLYDTRPLRELIGKIASEGMINAIAEEHRQGRRLYVATTDLDLGQVMVWDMGGIAASNHPSRYDLYRQILVASTAMPGFFQPVYIPGEKGAPHMHVDGGVKAPILLRSFMVKSRAKRKNVYVLVNGKISLAPGSSPVSPTLKNISQRSISELLRGLLYKTTYQTYVTTKQGGAHFSMIYVPDTEHEIEDALRFNSKEMQRLCALGERMGSDLSNWKNEPPRLEPLERIATRN